MDIETYCTVISALYTARTAQRNRVKFWFDAAREDRSSMCFSRERCIEDALRSREDWKKTHKVILNAEKLFSN